jgi:hypothetical protein
LELTGVLKTVSEAFDLAGRCSSGSPFSLLLFLHKPEKVCRLLVSNAVDIQSLFTANCPKGRPSATYICLPFVWRSLRENSPIHRRLRDLERLD